MRERSVTKILAAPSEKKSNMLCAATLSNQDNKNAIESTEAKTIQLDTDASQS